MGQAYGIKFLNIFKRLTEALKSQYLKVQFKSDFQIPKQTVKKNQYLNQYSHRSSALHYC